MTASAAAIAPARAITFRLALTALAATSIEWYDFFLYGTAAALVFPAMFFSRTLPPVVALLASFSTFAVGFIARPVGAALFGHWGDRHGRPKSLALALITMGLSTTLIGSLPPYSAIGAIAPALLILLRFTQGLAVGGQWGCAMLMITEHVPESQRGFYGSFAQAGVPMGLLLANLTFLIVGALTSEAAVKMWAWRLPFLFSVLLVGFGLLLHFRSEDGFIPGAVQPQRSPVLEALRRYPREILLAGGTFMASTVVFYMSITFSLAYGSSTGGLHLSASVLLTAVLIASCINCAASFLIGRLADALGRRRTIMIGAVLAAVWAFILFPLLNTRSFTLIVLALSLGQIVAGLMYVPCAALITGMFDKSVRCSAASLSYQIGAILGGGLAPFVATALFARFNNGLGVAVYISVACLISLLSVALVNEYAGAKASGDATIEVSYMR